MNTSTDRSACQATGEPARSRIPYWQDARFWVAIAAGPLSWLLLALCGMPLKLQHKPLLPFLTLVLAYPVLEEIVFRGGLQAALFTKSWCRRHRWNISIANLIVSGLFAAAHLFNQPPLWAAAVFLPSLIFGWARDRYDSVFPPMALHVVYNAGFIGLFVLLD